MPGAYHKKNKFKFWSKNTFLSASLKPKKWWQLSALGVKNEDVGKNWEKNQSFKKSNLSFIFCKKLKPGNRCKHKHRKLKKKIIFWEIITGSDLKALTRKLTCHGKMVECAHQYGDTP